MRRFRIFSWIVSVSVLAFGALLDAQFVQVRDRTPAQEQPTERRIPVGGSSISGTVVSSETGRPIPRAHVNLNGSVTSGQGWLDRAVTTDDNGRFSFPRMPAGSYQISVYQTFFLQTNYGQKRQNEQGKPIQLADGQQLMLTVPMHRGGILGGTVTGPDGEPYRNAQVQAYRLDVSSGFKRLNGNGYAQTDDRGVYRMFGLQPGEYVVSATPNRDYDDQSESQAVERAIATGPVLPPTAAGMTPTVSVPISPQPGPNRLHMASGYLPTYAPSAMTPSAATLLTVVADEEKTGVDIRLQLTQATNIVGNVTTSLDPGVLVHLSLVSQDATIDGAETNSTQANPNGMFSFQAVRPGSYYLIAQTVAAPAQMSFVNGQPVQPRPPQPVLTDAQKLFGRTQVSIAGEATVSVNVSMQPAHAISGVVVCEMSRPPDFARAKITVTLGIAPSAQQFYLAGPQPQAEVGPDGRFTITGVPPGRFTVRVNNGTTRSAVVAGQDVMDFPLEFTSERDITDMVVTVTDRSSELTGTIIDAAGKPAVNYTIIVAASDSRYWLPGSRRIAVGRPDQTGRYTFQGLPSGAYQIAAVVDLEPGAQFDPEVLRTVARSSVPVTMTGTNKTTQDLRVK